jgi:hypothetical protein
LLIGIANSVGYGCLMTAPFIVFLKTVPRRYFGRIFVCYSVAQSLIHAIWTSLSSLLIKSLVPESSEIALSVIFVTLLSLLIWFLKKFITEDKNEHQATLYRMALTTVIIDHRWIVTLVLIIVFFSERGRNCGKSERPFAKTDH